MATCTFGTIPFPKSIGFLLQITLCIFILIQSGDFKKEEYKVLPNQKERCLHKFSKNLMITKALKTLDDEKPGKKDEPIYLRNKTTDFGVFVYYSGADEEKPVSINCGFKPGEQCFPRNEQEKEIIEHILVHDFKLFVNETHIENANRSEYEKDYLSHEFCASGFCTIEAGGAKSGDPNQSTIAPVTHAESGEKEKGHGIGVCSEKCVKGLGCGEVHHDTTSIVFSNGDPPKDAGTKTSITDFGIYILVAVIVFYDYFVSVYNM